MHDEETKTEFIDMAQFKSGYGEPLQNNEEVDHQQEDALLKDVLKDSDHDSDEANLSDLGLDFTDFNDIPPKQHST